MEKMSTETEKKIWDKLSIIGSDMARVLSYLEDDDKTDTKGVVRTARDTAKRVAELEAREKELNGKIARYGVIGGGIITFFIWVVQLLFSKNL
jgi:hypothetical protein